MRASDALISVMKQNGADRIFCVPGESFLPLLDSLYDDSAIQIVIARHEGGAGLMAVADGKITGRPGICVVSRGPGAMNAALAIHVAQQDAVPLILIIGQVARSERGRGAFQEMDYAKTFSDSAKAVWEITNGSRVTEIFQMAWNCALSGVPGPVVLSIPEDVFSDEASAVTSSTFAVQPSPVLNEDDLATIERLLSRSRQPVLIAGGSLNDPRARIVVNRAVHLHSIPVLLSYKRQDLFDNEDSLYAGHLGFKIPQQQINLLLEADLVLAVGTRLTDVTTQGYSFPAHSGAPLIHVYRGEGVLGKSYQTPYAYVSDAGRFMEALARQIPPAADSILVERHQWAERLHAYVETGWNYRPNHKSDGIEFGAVVKAAEQMADDNAVIAIDAGNFSSWVHRLWRFKPDNLIIGAVGGAMGVSIPGGVSAALRFPERQIICFVGDGGFMMTGSEFSTAVAYGAAIKIFVSSNGAFGTIRQHQELKFPDRPSGTKLHSVDFAAYARACGATGFTIRNLEEAEDVVAQAFACDEPCIVDVRTSLQAISAFMSLEEAAQLGRKQRQAN